jgi:hypothetical protein
MHLNKILEQIKRLVNASSEPITGSQVSAGNRYIAYFNKCDNVIQLMNYTPAPAA